MKVKALLFIAFFPAIGVMFFGCTADKPAEGVKIVAHRGAMSDRPENTMVAFEHALELGAEIVELDLRTSRDGHLYILHDRTLDRTTNAEGDPSERTLAELQQLDAGSWFDPAYSDQTIPSVREVMNWARESGAVLLLDLKESGREFAENVSHEVRAAGVEDNVVVGVRSTEQAQEFAELLPGSRQLAFMSSPDYIEDFAEAGVDVIRLWLRWLDDDPTLAEQVRKTGKKLMINGRYGELEETVKIMSFEPDWILIDDIAQLKASLEEMALTAGR